jgi:hypothetical protein
MGCVLVLSSFKNPGHQNMAMPCNYMFYILRAVNSKEAVRTSKLYIGPLDTFVGGLLRCMQQGLEYGNLKTQDKEFIPGDHL